MTDTERREQLGVILTKFELDGDMPEAIEAIEELFSLKPFRRPTRNLAPPDLQQAFAEGRQPFEGFPASTELVQDTD